MVISKVQLEVPKIHPKSVRLGGGGGAGSAEHHHLTIHAFRDPFHRKTVIVDRRGGEGIGSSRSNVQLQLYVFSGIVDGLTGYKIAVDKRGLHSPLTC